MENAELPDRDQGYCVIKVRGTLDAGWSSWFDSLRITVDAQGDTVLAGVVADQAALYGLISRARDLGLTLISVEVFTPDDERG